MEVTVKKGTKYMLQYAMNLNIPAGGSTGNMEMKYFRTFIGMCWFVIRDKVACAALKAGRVRVITIKKDK